MKKLISLFPLNLRKEGLSGIVSGYLSLFSLVVFQLVIYNSEAFPQSENQNQNDFFPKDYAEAPSVLKDTHEPEERSLFEREKGDSSGKSKSTKPPQDGLHKDTAPDSTLSDQIQGEHSMSGEYEKSSSIAPSNTDQELLLNGISDDVKQAILSAEYISAIIDCELESTCTNSLVKMHQVSLETKLPIRHILVINLIGTDKSDTAPSLTFGTDIPASEAVDYSARLVFLTSLPENYPIERTPSWIIGTKQGEIILDGVSNPNKLLKALRKI